MPPKNPPQDCSASKETIPRQPQKDFQCTRIWEKVQSCAAILLLLVCLGGKKLQRTCKSWIAPIYRKVSSCFGKVERRSGRCIHGIRVHSAQDIARYIQEISAMQRGGRGMHRIKPNWKQELNRALDTCSPSIFQRMYRACRKYNGDCCQYLERMLDVGKDLNGFSNDPDHDHTFKIPSDLSHNK